MRLFKVFLLLLLLPFHNLMAQETRTFWLGSFNTVQLGRGFSLHFDGQLRTGDEFSRMQTLLLRPGLNYSLTKRWTLTAGYGYISTRRVITGVSGYAPEHRTWQQAVYTHPFLHASLAHRFRLEQRFISRSKAEGGELVNDGNVYSNRFRYFFRSVLPLKGGRNFTRGVFGAVQNELMFNLGNKDGVNGKSFDQNRAYLAMGYRFSKQLDLEAGYMNQYVEGRANAFTNNHVLQLAIYTRL